ncbi:MAG: NADH-quinone oxidoreductase subunit L [Sandaracinaceae bacterium]|nr:NADH-quinone oxidoreductase subunit L [Sandaracinaceae bacterium]
MRSPLSEAPLAALVAVLAPALAALLLAVLPMVRRRGAPAAWICLASSVASLVSAGLLLAGQLGEAEPMAWTTSWLTLDGQGLGELGVNVDGISASMLVVVTIVALCVQVFSVSYMHDEPPDAYGRYFTYHALFLFSMNLLVLAPDLLQLFAGWELVGVTSYLLIGFYYRKPSAGRAALKAFWITKLADMGFILALAVLFTSTSAFRFDAELSTPLANVVAGLLFFAVVGKSAQFPLHIWLPDAMEGPTPVSALLHAATMVAAGVFLVVRADPIFAHAPDTREVMLVVGSLTALFAAGLATVQTDIKKVLAYSTCSQLGYMVAALGAGSTLGGYFHLTTHAFFKALLFLSAGSVIHAVHSNELADMGGLRKRMPLTATAFIVGSLALAGIPGTAGFFSKDLVLAALEGRMGWLPYVALMTTAFLTAFYMGRVVLVAFFGEARGKADHAHESGALMLGPLAVLAVLSLGVGYFGAHFAEVTATGEYHLHFGMTPAIASGLALGGFALAYAVFGGGRDASGVGVLALLDGAARSALVDRTYEALYRHGMLNAAAAIGWFDRYVMDGLVNLSGWLTLVAARSLRRLQSGFAPDYVFAVVLGALALAAWGYLS